MFGSFFSVAVRLPRFPAKSAIYNTSVAPPLLCPRCSSHPWKWTTKKVPFRQIILEWHTRTLTGTRLVIIAPGQRDSEVLFYYFYHPSPAAAVPVRPLVGEIFIRHHRPGTARVAFFVVVIVGVIYGDRSCFINVPPVVLFKLFFLSYPGPRFQIWVCLGVASSVP